MSAAQSVETYTASQLNDILARYNMAGPPAAQPLRLNWRFPNQ